MLDHHNYLGYKNSSNTWIAWSAQNLSSDNVTNGAYYWHKINNADYEICASGSSCPWQ